MGWFRKIFHVCLVIGVAALMSIPFKRVPPERMTKSTGRGEWQLVKPRLQFKELLGKRGTTPLEAPDDLPAGQLVPDGAAIPPVPDATVRPEAPDRLTLPDGATVPDRPNPDAASPASRRDADSASPPASSDSFSPTASLGDMAARPVARPTPTSSRRPLPTDDPQPIRDQEAYPMSPLARLPRIESQPPRPARLLEEAPPPPLPTEFTVPGSSRSVPVPTTPLPR